MKLAVVGSGPLALLCAKHFYELGAHVVLFQRNPLGGNTRFLLSDFPNMKIDWNNAEVSIKDFWETVMVPLITSVESSGITKAGDILRVHKRFLHKFESIENRSRLHDLFRVIYSVNPKDSILAQVAENQEIFNQLGEDVLKSLHQPVESFEDFDLVIEASGLGRAPAFMGAANAPALNELNLKNNAPLFYEKEIFTKFSFEGKKHIILVGDSKSSILTLLKSQRWLYSSKENTLTWVTHSPVGKPFTHPWFNKELHQMLLGAEELFENEKIHFEEKMREWRDLEDYMKAKVAMPLEPEAKIKIFQGYNVTSVDKLLDREQVFVTIESPDFRSHALASKDLKTLAADAILVCNGIDEESIIAKGLSVDEPGYFRLEASSITEGLGQIAMIEKKILTYFSRAD